MPSIDQMRAARAVADTGSFSRAAQHLNKSQSAISKSISDLERQLGFEIFDRSDYRPRPTELGVAYLSASASVVAAFHRLSEYAKDLEELETPSLTLAIEGSMDRRLLNAALDGFGESYPSVHLTILSGTCGYPLGLVREGLADLALTTASADGAALERRSLGHLSFANVATPKVVDRLNRHQEKQTKCCIPQVFVRDALEDAEPVNCLVGMGKWSVDTFEMKRDLIRAGYGWGRLPVHIAEAGNDNLMEIKIPGFPTRADFPLWLVRQRAPAVSKPKADLWERFVKAGAL